MSPKPVVVAIKTLSEYLVSLGLEAGKNHFKDRFEEKRIQSKLKSYIERQRKYNEMCTLAEEIDFEGLIEYIRQQLMFDVEKRLFGRKQERGSARESIVSCSVEYSKANTSETRKRVVRLVTTAIDIIFDFYRSEVDKKDLLLVAEIEDTVTEEIQNLKMHIEENTNSKMETIKKEIIEEVRNSKVSVRNQDITAAIFQEKGNSEGLKYVLNCAAGAVQYSHPLSPYYETAVEMKGGVAHVKSVPAIPEAKERYPQTVQAQIKVPVPKGSTFNKLLQRAYISQTPLDIEMMEMKKMLGETVDPFQNDFQKKWKEMQYRIVPSELPPPLECILGIQGYKEIFAITLAFQPVNPDEHIIVLSNQDYNEEIQISLTYHGDSRRTDIRYAFHGDNWKQFAKFIKFMLSAKQGNNLYINTTVGNSTLFFANLLEPLYGQEYECLSEYLNLIKDIMLIEAQFDISLNPAVELQEDDFEMIKFLADSIKGVARKCTWDKFIVSAVPIPVREETNLSEVFIKETSVHYVERINIIIQDQTITDVPVEVVLNSAKFENPQTVIAAYEKIKETTTNDLRIEISMIPGSDGNDASRRVLVEEM